MHCLGMAGVGILQGKRFIVDHTGQVWDPYDERFLVAIGDRDPDYDIVRYAVRHLGYVEVDLRDQGEPGSPPDGATTLRFRELTASPRALAEASRLLASLPERTVIITRESDRWETLSFAGPAQAFEWLEARQLLRHSIGSFRDVAIVPRDVRLLAERRLTAKVEQTDDKLALMFKKWRMTGGEFREDIPEFLVRCDLLDRSVIAQEGDDGQIVCEYIGADLNMYGDRDTAWQFEIIGRPVADQPDRNYGLYVEQTFREALQRNVPAFDHVDAVIRGADQAHRSRYDRLVLPWRGKSGQRVVTTLSYKTANDISA